LTTLPIADITVDPDVQQRVSHVNLDLVAEYAEAIHDDATFPPVVVFHDGSEYWLADGFHRVEAARQAGLQEIQAYVRQGGRRDAVFFAVGANVDHGAQRTKADKRRAVETLLSDPEWSQRADSWIAGTARVSHTFVARIREAIGADVTCNVASDVGSQPDGDCELGVGEPALTNATATYRTAKDGRVMNVARIGRKRRAQGEQPACEKALTPEDAQQVVERFKAACLALRKVELTIRPNDAFDICSRARDTLIHFMKQVRPRDREDILRKINAGEAVSPGCEVADAQA